LISPVLQVVKKQATLRWRRTVLGVRVTHRKQETARNAKHLGDFEQRFTSPSFHRINRVGIVVYPSQQLIV
jgi:hypothetical protein